MRFPDRLIYRLSVLIVIIFVTCLALFFAQPVPSLASTLTFQSNQPPVIENAGSQVTVRSDGSLDIIYRLTFRETASRRGITKMGQFDPGHQMLDAQIEYDGQAAPIHLNDLGDGFYSADFGQSTRQ